MFALEEECQVSDATPGPAESVPAEQTSLSSRECSVSSKSGDREHCDEAVPKQSIELSRRAIPIIEAERDVCSICLDSFTDEDPSVSTQCRYGPSTLPWRSAEYKNRGALRILSWRLSASWIVFINESGRMTPCKAMPGYTTSCTSR